MLPGVDLQELSDRAEITDVLVRYTRAIDTGEWDRLDTVFTPDAQIDYTESGGIAAGFAEVKPWLAEVLPAFFPKRMHTLGQVEIRRRLRFPFRVLFGGAFEQIGHGVEVVDGRQERCRRRFGIGGILLLLNARFLLEKFFAHFER